MVKRMCVVVDEGQVWEGCGINKDPRLREATALENGQDRADPWREPHVIMMMRVPWIVVT